MATDVSISALFAFAEGLIENAPETEAEKDDNEGAEGKAEANIDSNDCPVKVTSKSTQTFSRLVVTFQTGALVVDNVTNCVANERVSAVLLVTLLIAVRVWVAQDLMIKKLLGLLLGISSCKTLP